MAYPKWIYFPLNAKAPAWVAELVGVVASQEKTISTEKGKTGLSSNQVLAALAPGLRAIGYDIESGPDKARQIERPVLFGEEGIAQLPFDIDGAHDGLGIVLEVEAGRGARGNATYRDLIRASLIVNARFFALLLPLAYRHQQLQREVSVPAYGDGKKIVEAIYASQRLRLPFEGVLLVGY